MIQKRHKAGDKVDWSRLPEANKANLRDTIIRIAKERRVILESLKQALIDGRNDDAIMIAKKYCGISEEQRNKKSKSQKHSHSI
jgi:hypothetical protein